MNSFLLSGLYYKGAVDCLRQSVASEGFLSLYKGFVPTWLRSAPWVLVFWVANEQFRILLGVETF